MVDIRKKDNELEERKRYYKQGRFIKVENDEILLFCLCYVFVGYILQR